MLHDKLTMEVSGKEEPVPPYPHHKRYIYLSRKYFYARNMLDHARLGQGIALKETARAIWKGFFIPRMILLDPTTRCNLHCKGCWAADYEHDTDLPFEMLDDILGQAGKLGIRACLLTGGEPLVRKDDIIRLCEKHRKISFAVFTNGTLIDSALAAEAARVGNLGFYLSIEGWREETDGRRGSGVFDQVVRAMDILKAHEIAFGFSACYHAKNVQAVTSDEFLDFLQEKGCWFGWLFQYVPVGSGADLSLVLSPEQREFAMSRFDAYSRKTGMMLIDFWNSGHIGFGCLGAGTGFVHINAHGDVEPCAFCHYADSNLYRQTLAEALRSPFFRAFRREIPFSENPLSGCPLMNRPDILEKIVVSSGARSTHMGCPETVGQLAAKTLPSAKMWQPEADRLFAGFPREKRRLFQSLLRYIRFKQRTIDR